MFRIELHGVETIEDIRLAEASGLLPDGSITHRYECDNCDVEIGLVDGELEPFVIALEDDDRWTVCFECAEAVTHPEPTSST